MGNKVESKYSKIFKFMDRSNPENSTKAGISIAILYMYNI